MLQAIRENGDRASACGYDVNRVKHLSFVFSAFFAGLAGGLDAMRLAVVPVESLYWVTSGQVVIMTLLGGAGTFFGPFVGAGAYLVLGDRLAVFTERWPLVIGLIFMAFVLFLPKGIWGTLVAKLPGAHTAGGETVTKEDIMAVKVLELHHHGIRVNPEETEKSLAFYRDVLGLARRRAPEHSRHSRLLDGLRQRHADPHHGLRRNVALRQGPRQDPTTLHVALAVPDVQEAKRELDRMGVKYWSIQSVVGPQLEQIFMDDPHGNLIELHEAGTCRCKKTTRKSAADAKPSMAG